MGFVDEKLVAKFPDEIEFEDAGGLGRATRIDGADDKSHAGWDGGEVSGDGLVGLGDAQPEP